MNKIIILSLAISSLAFSNANDEKLDQILENQETIKKDTKIIKKNTEKVSPIASKTFGVELNPFWLLYAGDDDLDGTHLTGGIQLFSIDRNAEISLPFIIHDASHWNEYSLDAHYKRFLGDTQEGFYLNGFIRYSNIQIKNLLSVDFENQDTSTKDFNDNRFGLGFGFGYRVYSKMGLYWGFGIGLGRFFIHEDPIGDTLDLGLFNPTSNFIFDVEIFKFGYAF